MTEAVKSNNDLWVDDFTQLATAVGPQNIEDAISDPDSLLTPTIVTNVGEQEETPAVVHEQVGPPPVAEEPEPQVYQYEDGSSVTIEKTKKGWEATLDSGTGAQPEVFKGATKDEMFARLAVGKINATKKIRELSRQPLLSDEPVERPQAQPVIEQAPAPKRLTADEMFDLKAKLEDNPDLAFESWFQKRTGMTPEELVSLTKTAAQKSDTAQETSEDTAISQILQNWVEITDDYFVDERNRDGLLAWLLKYKARQNPKSYSVSGALSYLYQHDLLTTENLDLAWEDLKADGQAVLPRAAEPEPAPAPVPTTRTRTRPAGGLGIRSNETTARPTTVTAVEPSELDIRSMTPEQTDKAMNDLRRFKLDHPEEYARLKAIGDAKRRGV